MNIRHHISGFLTGLACYSLLLTGCSDNSQNVEINSAPEFDTAPDQQITTPGYIFSIFETSTGKLFTVHRHDHSLVVSDISQDDLMLAYPDIFDELVLSELSDDLDGRIFFDQQNRRLQLE
jgi:hypothetical protein